METPLVYILVLNWNLVDITLDCVKSILESDYANYKILVIDNGSDDSNYRKLKKQIDEIESRFNIISIVRENNNLGFSRGMNVGIRKAIDNGADLILLINNDTILDPTMVSTMVAAMMNNPRIGILGPIIYYMHPPNRVWFSGYHISGNLFVIRRGYHLSKNDEILEEVDFVNGCGMMIRKQVFDDIGYLPDVYFMYYEDLEFCLKAKRRGWKLACHKLAKMWHAVSMSSNGKDAIQKELLQVKSSIIFFQRNTKGLYKSLNIGLRLLQAGLFCIKSYIKNPSELKMIYKHSKEIFEFLRRSEIYHD